MKVRFAFRSRFPKQIERILPSPTTTLLRAAAREKPVPAGTAGYICPRCFVDFKTAEDRKAHRPVCDMGRLAARAAKVEPLLAKMNPRQRERVEKKIREEFLRLVTRIPGGDA